MTSYSRGSPYGRKYSTEFHLIYQIENGELFFSLGLYEAREQAERELALVNAPTRPGGWKIADLNCIGFGIIDGVVSRNELSTAMTDTEWRKIGKEVDETLWTAWQRDA